jgi:hypothetical protein
MAGGNTSFIDTQGRITPTNLVTKTVTVNAAASTGTVTVVAGSTVLGIYPAGNQDQYVDNVAIAGTTLTITLAAAATATNTYKVTLLEP